MLCFHSQHTVTFRGCCIYSTKLDKILSLDKNSNSLLDTFQMIIWSSVYGHCISGKTVRLTSSLLHDRDTCWERKENNCTALESWNHARGAQCQRLCFTLQRNLLKKWHERIKRIKNISLESKLGSAPMIACSDVDDIDSWKSVNSIHLVDRDFIAVLMKEVHKVLWKTFFFCFAVLWKCCVFWNDKDACIWGGPLGCVSGPGLHTYIHTHTDTRTRDQRQSGSHPCLPLICVPRPACPRGTAPYHARWHHAHQRLPTTVWER